MSDSNGNGKLVSALVTNPVVIAVARAAQLIVMPLLVFLFAQLWNGLEQARAEFRAFDRRVSVLETRIFDIDRRLIDIDRRMVEMRR